MQDIQDAQWMPWIANNQVCCLIEAGILTDTELLPSLGDVYEKGAA